MNTFKITRASDGRVVAICEQCGATSGVPRSDMQASRWQRKHGNAHATDPHRARLLAPKGGRA